ncbi:unnamed protein product [Rangifer tarandus platyrhynchus]|uniref:Uncharacterized protein n=2 Tax=Rangifer tarandus platyrhynchus TaxID=3082113 RepID=A0AC59ZUM1_RANTA|nr:unnamed protein product [Rangifer tarandus platyrhynchus]
MRGAQACGEELGPSRRRDGPGVYRWDIQGGASDMLFILSFISTIRTSAHYMDSLAHMGCFGGGSLPWGTLLSLPHREGTHPVHFAHLRGHHLSCAKVKFKKNHLSLCVER